MAYQAGLKPNELSSLTPCCIWDVIEAHQNNEKEQWERVRALAYTVGKFGNSDPKKFPKTVQKFWGFDWDKKVKITSAADIMRQHAEMKAMREAIEKTAKHGNRSRFDSSI